MLGRFEYHIVSYHAPFECSPSSSLAGLRVGIGVPVKRRHSVSRNKFEYALQDLGDALETRYDL
jgi:hypothetical protein